MLPAYSEDDDVRLLSRHLGRSDPEDVIDVVVQVFGDRVDGRVQLFVREVLRGD